MTPPVSVGERARWDIVFAMSVVRPWRTSRVGRVAHLACAGALALAAMPLEASAQSLSLDAIAARTVARAGAGLLSDDLGGAWAHNPAAASRRTSPRALVGISLVDGDLELSPFTEEPSPVMISRAGVARAPIAAIALSWGETTFGLSFLSAQRVARRFEGPPSSSPEEEVQRDYSMRYAGLSGALRRELVMGGVSRRLGRQLALGLSVGAARVALRENRHVWGGLEPRDRLADSSRDVELLTRGEALGVPMATAGLVFVPDEGQLELAAAVSYVGAATIEGVVVTAPADVSSPEVSTDGQASLELPAAWVVRTGARWASERWSVELAGQLELWPASARELVWRLPDTTFIDGGGATAPLRRLPSQLSLRSLASLRAAVDREIIDDLLWLVGGIAWSPIGTSPPRLAPGFGEEPGVTLAAGLEASAGGVTVAFGLSHLRALPQNVRHSLRRLDSPFPGGDAPTGFARYQSSTQIVGFSIEIEQL